MTMRTVKLAILMAISMLVVLGVPATALAQASEPALALSMRRDFGYGGFGEVQGAMSLKVAGPVDLTRVVFFLDGQQMGEVTSSPWQLAFHTDSYASGSHAMTAVGYSSDGQSLQSNEIRVRFLSAEQASRATSTLIVSLLGGIGLLMLLSIGISNLVARRRPTVTAAGPPRNYGLAGGAICPRCSRPYARHMFAPNLVLGKLERCPYCGRWAIVAARSPAELAAAEAAELHGTSATAKSGDGEVDLKRDLDDTRFQD